MSHTVDQREWYLSAFEGFERRLNGRGASPLLALRKAAIARFVEQGFPTSRDEEWRYTSVAPIAKGPFEPGLDEDSRGLTADRLRPFTFGDAAYPLLVFVNGLYVPNLSSPGPLPGGAQAGSLAVALETRPALVTPHLARYARTDAADAPMRDQHAFASLNTAFIRDGAFLHLPKGAVVETPIHFLFLSASRGRAVVSHPRALILAEAGSRATVIESYIGLDDGGYFTNGVTEVVTGEGAGIDHYKLQCESREAFHIGRLHAHLGRNSQFGSTVVSLGGALARNEVTTVLDGEGAASTLNGFYLLDGRQHVDNHTWIEHVREHGTSRELYKGILGGSSTGVFRGRIFVHKEAQKTDAIQSNRTLVLSGEAKITTRPQLEIYADDVRCTHGATVGQLDENAIFYLRSRGIGLESARQLLVQAFASELLDLIRVEPVRALVERLALDKLEAGRRPGEAR